VCPQAGVPVGQPYSRANNISSAARSYCGSNRRRFGEYRSGQGRRFARTEVGDMHECKLVAGRLEMQKKPKTDKRNCRGESARMDDDGRMIRGSLDMTIYRQTRLRTSVVRHCLCPSLSRFLSLHFGVLLVPGFATFPHCVSTPSFGTSVSFVDGNFLLGIFSDDAFSPAVFPRAFHNRNIFTSGVKRCTQS